MNDTVLQSTNTLGYNRCARRLCLGCNETECLVFMPKIKQRTRLGQ